MTEQILHTRFTLPTTITKANVLGDDYKTSGGYFPREQDETYHKSSRSVRYHPYNMPTSRSADKAFSKMNFLSDDMDRQGSSVISVFPVPSPELPIGSRNGSLTTTVPERESTPSATDCSMTSLNSLSPASVNTERITSTPSSTARSSGSVSSSPQTDAESECSGDKESDKKSKKPARTNYTKEQLQSLVKFFHENPYPDSEMMENIAKDFGIKDTNIKIWFQNKRARWRRRVENINNSTQSNMMHMTPVPSSIHPYVPMYSNFPSRLSPQNNGYMHYPWMQTVTTSPNNNSMGQHVTFNQLPYRQSTSTASLTPYSSYYQTPSPMTTSWCPTPAARYSVATSSQDAMTSNTYRQFPHMVPGIHFNSYVC
ncbi:pituitary homeobox x-like [Dreissena polymorpha]|nr:pituitary homeobox x-like [Dreissena polymorpha]